MELKPCSQHMSTVLKLVDDKIHTKLDARNVDNGQTLMHPIKTGWKWNEATNRMEWSEEQEADNMANSIYTERTARTIKDIVNSCNKTLRCTVVSV